MEQHLLMAQVEKPEIREGNKDVGVLQTPLQYVPDIRLSFDTIAALHPPMREEPAVGEVTARHEPPASDSIVLVCRQPPRIQDRAPGNKCRVPVLW